ncbi:serine hydrolase domain-containing protein [Chitinophaga rhizophila]|uniref:Beta-lactamase family protein n=1 Tax=Chitinophaga rhizophila TaxID=2866212 RepID=A0ABS7G917_9BACT|nr:serine hydrolase domain-containing protein [Chitinophaga rhizophila]MBW8683192.1 beta-lactamase family protein [Chitinophaga rhizophila]
MKYAIFLINLLLISIGGVAQQRLGKLNIYFNNIALQQYMNGNILLAEHGRPVYQRSFGYADHAAATPNTPDQRFNLASITKVFTATAILQLKEKGLLRLGDNLRYYLPQFPYDRITIRHLLTHTSGLPDLELYEPIIKAYPDTIVTNNIIIPVLIQEKRQLYFQPGSKFSYCNLNYSLLALLIEKLSGQSFQAYLVDNIFRPAGMLMTNAVACSFEPADKDIATPHVYDMLYDTACTSAFKLKRYRYTSYNNSAATGASNVVTTVHDLLLFDKAFFAGKLLSTTSMQEAFTPVVLNNGDTTWEHMDTMQGEGRGSYGLGWEIFEQPAFGKAVGHGGFNFGLATFYYRNLDKQQTIIAFDNFPGPPFGSIVTSALHLLNNQPATPVTIKTSLARLFGQQLLQYGLTTAANNMHVLVNDTSRYYLSEKEMNKLGYEFLYLSSVPGHAQLAVATFLTNISYFPDSFNTYDSYAEALSVTGSKQEAIRMYRKSIALNPDNRDGIKALERLLSQP